MLGAVLILLIILWILGYIRIPNLNMPNIHLFTINGHNISLYEFLIFLVIIWILGLLPSPFRQIAGVVLILWLLSLIGIISIAGLPNILIISLIVGLLVFMFSGR